MAPGTVRRLRRSVAWALPACLAIGAPASSPARGSDDPAPGFQTPAPDSAETRRTLRSAQARFERLRRRTLPWTTTSSHPCDRRIGPYCFWLSKEDDVPETEEPPEVGSARVALLAQLDSAAGRFPGDPWIAGQRVRYYLESDEPGDAIRAAADCAAREAWWCGALRGFALHVLHRYDASERAYRDALSRMPEAQRCDWTDLSDVLPGRLRGRYRRLPCAGRDTLQQTILWLADPMHAIPGNQFLTEHLSRHTVSLLYRDSATPSGNRWSPAMHEGLIRYGWGVWWERTRQDPFRPGPPSVVSHHQPGSRFFSPTDRAVSDPYATRPEDADLEPDRPPSWHTPGNALRPVDSLPHTISVFRRGALAVLVASFAVVDDSVPADADVRAALVLSRPGGPPRTSLRRFTDPSGTLRVTVRPDAFVVSVEVEAPRERRMARARYGHDLTRLHTPGMAMSDVLVTTVPRDRPEDLPETLPQAIDAARPPRPVAPGERLGLYWEVYGVGPAATTLTNTLVLRRAGKGILRRLAELTPFASDKPPISMTWQSVLRPGDGPARRALSVELPVETSPGRYTLRLQVHPPDGPVFVAERAVTVRERPSPAPGAGGRTP